MIFNKTMRKKLTLEKVIDVVKLSLFLCSCWPLPKNATKFKTTCVTLYQYLTLLLNLCFTLTLFNTVRNHLDDPIIIAKALLFMIATSYVVSTVIAYRTNHHRLQVINTNICNMNVFDYERDVWMEMEK